MSGSVPTAPYNTELVDRGITPIYKLARLALHPAWRLWLAYVTNAIRDLQAASGDPTGALAPRQEWPAPVNPSLSLEALAPSHEPSYSVNLSPSGEFLSTDTMGHFIPPFNIVSP